MALSDAQIERYSRQIILPGVGGRGQERLLASSLSAIGELEYLETALAYVAGAGVGALFVQPSGPTNRLSHVIDRLRGLNPSVKIQAGEPPTVPALVMIIISSHLGVAAVQSLASKRLARATVVVRLDRPPRIAILPAPRGCIACAEPDLVSPWRGPSPIAELVVMAATTEALKLMAGIGSTSPIVIEFHGLETRSKPARARPGCPICNSQP